MDELRLRATGACVSLAEYQALHPNVSFAADFEPINSDADFVTATPPPVADQGQCVVRAGAVKKDGKWVQAWLVRDMTPEELEVQAQAARDAARQARAATVGRLKVTTAAGHRFDADEVSQGRLARAVLAMQIGRMETMKWTLDDNESVEVPAAELSEALMLATVAQTTTWPLPDV